MVWNDLPDEVRSVLTLACFRKRLKSYLFKKGIPNLAYTLSGISMVLDLASAMARSFLNWILVLRLRVCLAEIKCDKSTE